MESVPIACPTCQAIHVLMAKSLYKPARCATCGKWFLAGATGRAVAVDRPTRRRWLTAGAGVIGVAALGGYIGYEAIQEPDGLDGPGINEPLSRPIFLATDAWNRDIFDAPLAADSAKYIESIGAKKPLHPDFGSSLRGRRFGIPYVVVGGDQLRVNVRFEYADQSDPGPYPIPQNPPIEGGPLATEGDRHLLIIDRDAWQLYELFELVRDGNGWKAGSGAIFNLTTNTVRPAGWTSADAAGLPILPGLVRYDEVMDRKQINHALRFTCRRTRKAYVPPARHHASKWKEAIYPPMGTRMRLRRSFDASEFPDEALVIVSALQRYGMILADNGLDWALTGTADRRWSRSIVRALKQIRGEDFEVLEPGPITVG